MKKALVVAMVMVLGLGALAFAGPLTGEWDTSISLDPSATAMSAFFTDFSSSLDVDYVVGGWTFGSSTAFTLDGFSSQSFTASGVLGAFTFDSTMNFNPMAVTKKVYTYPAMTQTTSKVAGCLLDTVTIAKTTKPAFTDWTVTGSVSIAGVAFEGLFYLDGGTSAVTETPLLRWNGTAWEQTSSRTIAGTAGGSGWRFSVSGTAGDATITSLTYFNLSESDATASTTGVLNSSCLSIGKSGSYSIAKPGCGVGFSEEYITIEGISFGCMNLDLAVDVTCSGFHYFKALVSDITFLPWISLDAGVKFTTTSKEFSLCGSLISSADKCFSIDAALTTSDNDVTGIAIYGISMSYDFGGGITVSSDTAFNTTKHSIAGNVYSSQKTTFFFPLTGLYNTTTCGTSCCATTGGNDHYPSINNDGVGYYNAKCYANEYYKIWESFGIEATGDSCCGGSYDITVDTYFGDQMVLDGFAWAYSFTNADTTTYNVSKSYTWGANPPTITLKPVKVGTDTCWYKEALGYNKHYSAGTATTLFNWAKTEISGSFDLASNFSLTGGLSVSAYGWGSLSFGFGFTF